MSLGPVANAKRQKDHIRPVRLQNRIFKSYVPTGTWNDVEQKPNLNYDGAQTNEVKIANFSAVLTLYCNNTTATMLRSTVLIRSAGNRLTTSNSITPNNTLRCLSYSITSKKEIIDEIAKNHDLTLAQSGRILNTVLDTIVESVSDGKTVRLSKFGSFERVQVEARNGRNPQTGGPLYIPAKKRIKFKAYGSFKKTANEA